VNSTSDVRERNRRGEGGKLRAEILRAAGELLEQEGGQQAVTLRAVARQVGVSAPSIYAHFADRDAMLRAVVEDAFIEFIAAIKADLQPGEDPVTQLRAGCAAYLRFAEQRPNQYRTMFSRPFNVNEAVFPADWHFGSDAFQVLVDAVQACVESGNSTSTDPFNDAVALWVGMHGLAVLRTGVPHFPWPEQSDVLDRLIDGLAKLTP
jgi:AcrR family transcriptional regulator